MVLTRRQREIDAFVRSFIGRHGYAPSLEEIGAHFGLSSVATVHKHVTALVRKGRLRRLENRWRGLEPVEEEAAGEEFQLPLLGTVSAGAPIEALEVRETIAVPPELVRRPERSYALRVRGDSMIDQQIRDGDIVIVEGVSEARDGETVVALIRGEEATLKKLRRLHRGARVQLVPANPRLRPLELSARDVEIRGVVRGLLRRY